MKNMFIAITSLMVSATVWATPKVGDKALYNATMTSGTATYNYTLENAIVSQDAVSSAFNITQTTVYMGQTQTQTIQKTPDQLPDDATLASYVANCAQAGGQSETVTVGAGTFNTCKVLYQGTTSWVSTVPFGIVKIDAANSDGSHTHAELQSYTNGN